MIFLPSAGDYREVHIRPREGHSLQLPTVTTLRQNRIPQPNEEVTRMLIPFLGLFVCLVGLLFRRYCGSFRSRQRTRQHM